MTTPTPHDWESRSHVRTLVLLGATMLGVYLCYRMAEPFTAALVWAAALGVVFVPLQRWLESRLRRPNLAATLSVLVIGLMVVVPAIFVGQRMIIEAAKGAQHVETIVKSGEWRRVLDAQPRWAPLAERIGQKIDLPEAVQSLAAWLSSAAGAIVKGSLVQAIGFCLVFYLLFFFLRDRRAAFQALRVLSPLSETEMDRLLNRVGDTIHATIYGTLAVAVIQGILGGLAFWALGLPAPLLWGVVMSVLAIIPVLGTFVIWIPTACFLALEGNWGKALLLVAWGMLVIGTIDNLLRPILVGKRLKLHTVLAFLSVIGGLAVFGGAGLILGPVVLTITTVLLELWPHRTPHEAGSGIKPEELARFENEGGLLAPLERSPVGSDRNSSPWKP
ncbi:MAG: AI-2E family transporter [Verrucomicrobiaceae bacterium]|nr:MAG: AI-2E family transporter [Verrucomicrobiaceae bacterium]